MIRLVDADLRRSITVEREPFQLMALSQLRNLKFLQRKTREAKMQQAYEAAKQVACLWAELSREVQLAGISVTMRQILERSGIYTTKTPHCDAFGPTCGADFGPYQHPYF